MDCFFATLTKQKLNVVFDSLRTKTVATSAVVCGVWPLSNGKRTQEVTWHTTRSRVIDRWVIVTMATASWRLMKLEGKHQNKLICVFLNIGWYYLWIHNNSMLANTNSTFIFPGRVSSPHFYKQCKQYKFLTTAVSKLEILKKNIHKWPQKRRSCRIMKSENNKFPCKGNTPWAIKNGVNLFLSVTSWKINGFLCSFHC